MEKDQKIRKVIFFDDIKNAHLFFNRKSKECFNSHEILYVALNPDIYAYLKQKKCFVHSTFPYFNNSSHQNVLEASDLFLRELRKTVKFTETSDIQEAHRNIFMLLSRNVLHYYLFVTEVALNIIEEHKPEVLSVCCTKKKRVESFFVGPAEQYLHFIVQEIAQKKKISYENISFDQSLYHRFISWSVPFRSFFKFCMKGFIFEGKIIFEKMKRTHSDVIFTSKKYNMLEFIKAQKKNNLRHRFFPSEIQCYFNIRAFFLRFFFRQNLAGILFQKTLFVGLKDKIKTSELFLYREINFSRFFAQKMQDNLIHYFLGYMLWGYQIERFLKALRPLKVISNGDRFDDQILSRLCRKLHIPSVLISHGSHVGPKNKYEHIEWGEHGRTLLGGTPFFYLALQSPLAEVFLKEFPSESQILKTGPLTWKNAVKKDKSYMKSYYKNILIHNKTKIIVHAGTPKGCYRLRLYVYETVDEYIESLKDLALAVEKMTDVILIIRFRPRLGISVDTLEELVPFSNKVLLYTEGSFTDLLGAMDLLVSFSSTTIEETLQNKIPVLLYGGRGRYQHIPAVCLQEGKKIEKSAIYFISDKNDLHYGLEQILSLNVEEQDEKNFDRYIYSKQQKVNLPW